MYIYVNFVPGTIDICIQDISRKMAIIEYSFLYRNIRAHAEPFESYIGHRGEPHYHPKPSKRRTLNKNPDYARGGGGAAANAPLLVRPSPWNMWPGHEISRGTKIFCYLIYS